MRRLVPKTELLPPLVPMYPGALMSTAISSRRSIRRWSMLVLFLHQLQSQVPQLCPLISTPSKRRASCGKLQISFAQFQTTADPSRHMQGCRSPKLLLIQTSAWEVPYLCCGFGRSCLNTCRSSLSFVSSRPRTTDLVCRVHTAQLSRHELGRTSFRH